MCWQDIQIDRRTKNTVRRFSSSFTFGANVNRVAMTLILDLPVVGAPLNQNARMLLDVMNQGTGTGTQAPVLQTWYSEGTDPGTVPVVYSAYLKDQVTIHDIGPQIQNGGRVNVAGSPTGTLIETVLEIPGPPPTNGV